jgi:hypothetical protein
MEVAREAHARQLPLRTVHRRDKKSDLSQPEEQEGKQRVHVTKTRSVDNQKEKVNNIKNYGSGEEECRKNSRIAD